jgi:hypothetical protein
VSPPRRRRASRRRPNPSMAIIRAPARPGVMARLAAGSAHPRDVRRLPRGIPCSGPHEPVLPASPGSRTAPLVMICSGAQASVWILGCCRATTVLLCDSILMSSWRALKQR